VRSARRGVLHRAERTLQQHFAARALRVQIRRRR